MKISGISILQEIVENDRRRNITLDIYTDLFCVFCPNGHQIGGRPEIQEYNIIIILPDHFGAQQSPKHV